MTNINETLLRDPNIVFVEPIDTKLKCFLCNNLLVDAHIATCLHKFCKRCIHNHLEKSVDKKCIGTNQKCLQNQLNMTNSRVLTRCFEINDQIEKLLVYCKISGCKKVIPLEDLENHLNTCEFRIVTCSYQNLGCTTENIRSNELQTHINEYAINHGILICNEIEKNRNCIDQTIQEIRIQEGVFKDGTLELRNTLKNRVNEIEESAEEKIAYLETATQNQIEQLETATQNQIGHLQTKIQVIQIENEILKKQLKITNQQIETQKQELDQLKILLEPIKRQRKKDNNTECVIYIEDEILQNFERITEKGEKIFAKKEFYLKLRKFSMKVYLRRDYCNLYDILVSLKLEEGKYENEINLEEEFIVRVEVIDNNGDRCGRSDFVVNEKLKIESEKIWIVEGEMRDLRKIIANRKLKLHIKVK